MHHGHSGNRDVRCAFTLLELIVCIGVIGFLVSLLLPAVQSSRESARQTSCRNNLRQIGTALHSHESVHRYFPRAGDMLDTGSSPALWRAHPVHLYLLPHLAQTQLFQMIDLTIDSDRDVTIFPGVNDANEELKRVTIPVFLCPSDGSAGPGRRNNYRINVGLTAFPFYYPHYNVPQREPPPPAGAFSVVKRAVRPQDFRDGMSETVAFSEKLAGDPRDGRFDARAEFFAANAISATSALKSDTADADLLDACSSLTHPNPLHIADTGHYWFYAGLVDTWYNHLLTPNNAIPDCGSEVAGMHTYGVMTARSDHPGGVHCLMADGHVRFVANAVDDALWQAVATRDGNETISF